MLSGVGKTLSNLIPPVAAYKAVKTMAQPQWQQQNVVQPIQKFSSTYIKSPKGEMFPEAVWKKTPQEQNAIGKEFFTNAVFGATSPLKDVTKPLLSKLALPKPKSAQAGLYDVPKELQPLAKEASKYKTADEFVTAMWNKINKENGKIPGFEKPSIEGDVRDAHMAISKLFGETKIIGGNEYPSGQGGWFDSFAKFYEKTKGNVAQQPAGLYDTLQPLADRAKTMSKEDFVKQFNDGLNAQNLTTRDTAKNLLAEIKKNGMDVGSFYDSASSGNKVSSNLSKVDLAAPKSSQMVETSPNSIAEQTPFGYLQAKKGADGKYGIYWNGTSNNADIAGKPITERFNSASEARRNFEALWYKSKNVAQQPLSVPKGGEVGTKPLTQRLPEQSKILQNKQLLPEVAPKMKGVVGNEVSVLPKSSEIKVSSPKIISKYAENINLNRVNLKPNEKEVLKTITKTVKPELEKIKGKVLTNKEVIQAAKKSDILTKITTREETLQAEASILKARQRLVELDKDITKLSNSGNAKELKAKMTDMVDSLKVVSSSAADAGRKLESFSIGAEDQSVRTLLLKEVGKTEASTAKIVEEASKVNWDDANSITSFYRKFVKPSTMEILDEYRYNNMLSNPRTHIRNAFSNFVQTFFTRPATLAAQGKPAEALKYYQGALKNFPKAVNDFTESFKGTKAIEKPDIAHIGTNKLPKFLTIPSRAMEAGDKFFSAMIEGGELARGATIEEAAKMSEYSLFRQGLTPEGQGKLLNAIDSITGWTYKAPKAVRWFVPFIRTPMNFAKQWIEYSPAGLATLPGSMAKREQIGKMIVGSTVAAIGAKFALDGNTTWEAPVDPKQKELFYASGRKPFSVRVGNKWVSMMYAGPFAMALAIPAAVKYYQDESRTALTDTQMQKLGKVVASGARFLSGQTFLENIGNFVKFASGDADYSMPSNLAFTAGQIIPLEGLVRWVSTMVDPVYRKGTSFVEGLEKNIPFVSKNLEAYKTPEGTPSKREGINLITPYDISTNQSKYEPQLEQRTSKLQQNAVDNQISKKIETAQGGIEASGNKIFYWDADTANTKSIDLTPIEKPKLTGQTELDKIKTSAYNAKLTTQIKNIAKLEELGQITATEAEKKIKELTAMKVSTSKGKKVPKPSLKIKAMKKISLKTTKVKKITVKRRKLKKYTLKTPKLKKSKIKTWAKLA